MSSDRQWPPAGPGPFHLLRGDVVLGQTQRLDRGRAHGWLEGPFEPSSAWAAVAPLFAAASDALKYADRFPDAWDEAFAHSQGSGLAVRNGLGETWSVEAVVDKLTLRLQRR